MLEDKNIYQRMHAIMQDVSYVQKENTKVNNQYTFVSHDAVTSKIRTALLEHGVIAIPNYFDISVDGNRTNCSMSISFVNIDKPDDRIEIACAGFGQGIDSQDKGAGKAMSYAYKYALLKVFALETGDDPERDNINHKTSSDIMNESIFNAHNSKLVAFDNAEAFKKWWSEDSKTERESLPTHLKNELIKNMRIQSAKFKGEDNA